MDFFKLLNLDSLLENLKGYVETRIELLKLEVKEKVAKVITILVLLAFVAFFGILALLFINIAIAALLNKLLDSAYLGYLILGSFYLILMIVFAVNLGKGWLHRKLKNKIASFLTNI